MRVKLREELSFVRIARLNMIKKDNRRDISQNLKVKSQKPEIQFLTFDF
jgi:hypothetical protein